MKLSNILLEGLTYTPEKIDEFIDIAIKDLSNAKQILNKALDIIHDTNIKDLANSTEQLEVLLERIDIIRNGILKKYENYYSIVDMYEVGELPTNVSQLEKISDDLYDMYDKINDLKYVIEYLISAGKDLSKIKNI